MAKVQGGSAINVIALHFVSVLYISAAYFHDH